MACGVLRPVFGCPRMPMTFPKPVDFEFPREKVLRLTEQQVGLNELTSARNSNLFTRVLTRVLSSHAHRHKQFMHAFRAGPP